MVHNAQVGIIWGSGWIAFKAQPCWCAIVQYLVRHIGSGCLFEGPLPCPNRLGPDKCYSGKRFQCGSSEFHSFATAYSARLRAYWLRCITGGQVIVENFIVDAIWSSVVAFLFPWHVSFILVGHFGQLLLAHRCRRLRTVSRIHGNFIVNLAGGSALEMIGWWCTIATAAASGISIARNILKRRLHSGFCWICAQEIPKLNIHTELYRLHSRFY